MNCFTAAVSVTRLVDNLLAAAKSAGNGKMAAAKSRLADAALNAADLSKAGSHSIRKEAKKLSVEVFSLVNRPGSPVSVQEIIGLRKKANALKDATIADCRG
jgi:hypothetical protein